MDATPAQRTIAAGGNPPWEYTVAHPVHGELTFRARLPLAKDSLRHSIAVDNELGELREGASFQTMVVAAALAGLKVPEGNPAGKGLLIDLPAVAEQTEHDEDSGRDTVTRLYYDVEAEPDLGFLTTLWLNFSDWRSSLLSDATVSAVGKSSPAEGPSTPSVGSSTP